AVYSKFSVQWLSNHTRTGAEGVNPTTAIVPLFQPDFTKHWGNNTAAWISVKRTNGRSFQAVFKCLIL
ncbi:TPA: hypothetical protein ACG5DL_005293, partial [Klebsiella pneumoniae]